MQNIFLFLAAIMGLLAVAMGAFGAHGLKDVLTPNMLNVYKTAVDYQIWHALALGLIAVFRQSFPNIKLLIWAGWFIFAGIILFSGSLYLLTLLNIKALGIITPFGGTAFLIGWLLLAIASIKPIKNSDH